MSRKHLQSVAMVALAASVLALGACALAPAASSPASIDPPQGQPIMTLTASGIQIYSCEFDAHHRLGWVFQSPQATLFDRSGHAAVRHGAGPSWEAQDGSRIVGHVLSQRPSDNNASVPQLLLETHSVGGSGVLSAVRYVQRVHTVGGVMPAGACTAQGQVGSSPYLAQYVFYQ